MKKYNKSQKLILTCQIDKALDDSLVTLAKNKGVSKSDIVRGSLIKTVQIQKETTHHDSLNLGNGF